MQNKLILNSLNETSTKLENQTTFLYRNLKSELDREKEDSIELKNKLEELKADSGGSSSFSSNSLALFSVFFFNRKNL